MRKLIPIILITLLLLPTTLAFSWRDIIKFLQSMSYDITGRQLGESCYNDGNCVSGRCDRIWSICCQSGVICGSSNTQSECKAMCMGGALPDECSAFGVMKCGDTVRRFVCIYENGRLVWSEASPCETGYVCSQVSSTELKCIKSTACTKDSECLVIDINLRCRNGACVVPTITTTTTTTTQPLTTTQPVFQTCEDIGYNSQPVSGFSCESFQSPTIDKTCYFCTQAVATTTTPLVSPVTSCEGFGYHTSKVSSLQCDEVYITDVGTCYDCYSGITTTTPEGEITTTTGEAECRDLWLIDEKNQICVRKEFCKSTPNTYTTKLECEVRLFKKEEVPTSMWIVGAILAVVIISVIAIFIVKR